MISGDSDWPRLLDAHYSTFDEDLPFWISLADRFGGPLLELGCGPGRVLSVLAGHGFDVTGLDNDPAMLARARRRTPPSHDARVHRVEGDLRDFTLPKRFRLVLIPCNTFAGLTESDAAACLASVRRHLLTGGGLAIELPNPHDAFDEAFDGTEPITEFYEAEAGRPVQVYARQTFDPVARRLDVEWRYDELRSDGQVLRTLVPAVYHLRTEQDLASLLHGAGFARVDLYGDYASGPLLVTSERMLLVAEA
ncbi:MAG: class I SAM-dependent methyltransferase [Actinobacteria bacterium]|nr:class I SAM-dependent methyltransferase [Actinomycetota bacterium]